MATTTSHPVVQGTDVTVAYPTTGANAGYATLHRTGCSHASVNRQSTYGPSRHLGVYGVDFTPYADDYFAVAPCARAKKGA